MTRGSIALVVGLILAVAVSDFIGPSRRFWTEHQILSGLAAEAVMLVAVLLAVERLLSWRERRRWRGVALGALHGISMATDATDIVGSFVEERVRTQYGDELPDEITYADVLIETLGDPGVWEGDVEELMPPLLDRIREVRDDLERLFPLWSPVLIQSEELIPLANLLPELIGASRRLYSELEDAEMAVRPGMQRQDWITPGGFDRATRLVNTYATYDRLSREFSSSYVAYRDERRRRPVDFDGSIYKLHPPPPPPES